MARWRKLADLQARYVPPRLTRSWLVAVGVLRPAATTLPRIRIPDGIAVLRVDEKKEPSK